METLTKREEEIMQIIWKLKKGFVKDFVNLLPAPKPAYNTVSTIVRILEKKGFIDHTAYGTTYEYFPVVSKLAYKKYAFKKLISNYFEGAPENVVSFMINEDQIGEPEIREIKDIIEEAERKMKS